MDGSPGLRICICILLKADRFACYFNKGDILKDYSCLSVEDVSQQNPVSSVRADACTHSFSAKEIVSPRLLTSFICSGKNLRIQQIKHCESRSFPWGFTHTNGQLAARPKWGSKNENKICRSSTKNDNDTSSFNIRLCLRKLVNEG